MKKMLNSKNYHTKANKYLSTSMIKVFMQDKKRFKDTYIDRTFVREPSPSMVLGSMVDMIVTESMRKFKMNYTPACLKKDNPELFEKNKTGRRTVVSQLQYDTAVGMAESLIRTSAWQEVKDYQKQVVLTLDEKLNHGFKGLCGMLDLLYVDKKNNTAVIVDIKTSASFGVPTKYYYKALDYGYFLQMAMYGLLVSFNYNINIENIEYRHLVVVNDPDNIFPVYTYKFDDQIMQESRLILDRQIDLINNEKDFAPKDASWNDAIMLGGEDFN